MTWPRRVVLVCPSTVDVVESAGAEVVEATTEVVVEEVASPSSHAARVKTKATTKMADLTAIMAFQRIGADPGSRRRSVAHHLEKRRMES